MVAIGPYPAGQRRGIGATTSSHTWAGWTNNHRVGFSPRFFLGALNQNPPEIIENPSNLKNPSGTSSYIKSYIKF